MLRWCFLPEGEIGRIAFFALSVEVAGCIQYVVEVATGKFSVVIILVIFGYVEVNRAFAFVSVSGVQNLLYQLNLFDDMSRSMRFDAW